MAPEKGLVDVCESVSGFTALSHRPLSCNSILTGVLHFLWHSEPPHPFLPPPTPHFLGPGLTERPAESALTCILGWSRGRPLSPQGCF